MKKIGLLCLVTLFSVLICLSINAAHPQPQPPLWQVYQQSLKGATISILIEKPPL